MSTFLHLQGRNPKTGGAVTAVASDVFVTELRKAHSIFTAHKAGAKNLPELARRCGLRTQVVAEWVKSLKLPVEMPNPNWLHFGSGEIASLVATQIEGKE